MKAEGKKPTEGTKKHPFAYFKRKEGSNLKPPVKGAPQSREQLGRKASFLARMAGVKGPDYDEKGKPTRKLLALRAWGASSTADAKKKASALSERIKKMKD